MRNAAQKQVSRRKLIQSGLLIASGYACAPLAFANAASATSSDLANGEKTWTIANDLIR